MKASISYLYFTLFYICKVRKRERYFSKRMKMLYFNIENTKLYKIDIYIY